MLVLKGISGGSLKITLHDKITRKVENNLERFSGSTMEVIPALPLEV